MSGATKRLRIGVDARAFSSPAGGVRRYAHELYWAILAIDRHLDVIGIGATDDTPLPPGILRRRAIPFPTNLGWMAASIPLAVQGARLDAFHAPAYAAPLWGAHPLVLTIHDVSYERRPEWNAYKNDPLRRFFYRRSALAADRIITDSTFSKSEITAAYGIPAERIEVVPLAAGVNFSPGPYDITAAPRGVLQPYALHVGDLHIRRNVSTALAAVIETRRLAPAHRLSLVCAGIDRGIAADLRAQATAAGDPDALRLLGPMPEPALLNLYRGAAMLLYPSRYEGFGLPILEAMSCGAPVIGSNCASIPKLVGDAGTIVDAMDVAAWVRAIMAIIMTPVLAARLRDAGRKRASQFSWTRTAEQTLAILRNVARR
jgi:glycosyltransferase involved in cell wall biosynthesis